jgi:hypothetical protein
MAPFSKMWDLRIKWLLTYKMVALLFYHLVCSLTSGVPTCQWYTSKCQSFPNWLLEIGWVFSATEVGGGKPSKLEAADPGIYSSSLVALTSHRVCDILI